jgi:hypothetical protein
MAAGGQSLGFVCLLVQSVLPSRRVLKQFWSLFKPRSSDSSDTNRCWNHQKKNTNTLGNYIVPYTHFCSSGGTTVKKTHIFHPVKVSN